MVNWGVAIARTHTHAIHAHTLTRWSPLQAYIRRRYGSVSGYLCATGFGHAEQAKLRALLIDARPERI